MTNTNANVSEDTYKEAYKEALEALEDLIGILLFKDEYAEDPFFIQAVQVYSKAVDRRLI
jgi:hypothetical protein